MEINKIELRKKMHQIRNTLNSRDIEIKSQCIQNKIVNHCIYEQATCIFSYASFRNEVDTKSFHEKILRDGKTLALPKILSKEIMEFYEITNLEQLFQNSMGILEPDESCKMITPSDTKILMILPGLAYDHCFGRLGYGGGYYDRYLEKYPEKIIRCGIAYGCQIVEEVPTLPYDQLMDYIVTENEWMERMDIE